MSTRDARNNKPRLRLDEPMIASCISGGLKHSNNSDHVIVLNRSVQNLRLAVFRSDRTSILQRLRDAGFERIRFLRFLNAITWDKLQRWVKKISKRLDSRFRGNRQSWTFQLNH